ncbi:hypothetical protein L1049_012782 [Liquidambar formosana]|uniref:Transcription factor CBF/NF-Y/archaeal histone domain-containing protein n=1 Tax=Liquidambar formosana TaxID=63359 RepID=A0AAP0RKW2_LIQFO
MRNARPLQKRRRKTSKQDDTSNGTDSEPQVLNIPSSSASDSQSKRDSESEDEEPKLSEVSNPRADTTSKEHKQVDDDEDEGEDEEGEDTRNGIQKKKDDKALYRFPINRVKTIVRSQGVDDLRVSQEAVFLIGKASEKFLEQFCEDAYACSAQDHKNYVAYKHLSSVVCKQRRLDFLSDFIPEKLKAEDALEESKSTGT